VLLFKPEAIVDTLYFLTGTLSYGLPCERKMQGRWWVWDANPTLVMGQSHALDKGDTAESNKPPSDVQFL
jgi:hypothetical protein